MRININFQYFQNVEYMDTYTSEFKSMILVRESQGLLFTYPCMF